MIASTFARIFYRNAINIGLPILECDAAAKEIQAGDEVEVDFDTGVITDVTTGKTYEAQPFPPFIQNIIEKGGLLKSITEKIKVFGREENTFVKEKGEAWAHASLFYGLIWILTVLRNVLFNYQMVFCMLESK